MGQVKTNLNVKKNSDVANVFFSNETKFKIMWELIQCNPIDFASLKPTHKNIIW